MPDTGKPLLWENGGAFNDYQLENYLGIYEAMDGAYLSGQIDQSDFCDLFSYYLDEASSNKEIQNYVSKINNNGENFYGGLTDLEMHSQKECAGQNHVAVSVISAPVVDVIPTAGHGMKFPHMSLSDVLSALNLLVLAITAVIVWVYTRAAQRSNEIQEKPVLNMIFKNFTPGGGQLDGEFEIKNIGKGCAYNISFEHILIPEGDIMFTYKSYISKEVLEVAEISKIHMHTSGSDGRTEGDMSRFFFRMTLEQNRTENREPHAVIFVVNYKGVNGKKYHSIFRFYPRLILAYDPTMQFIKHGDGKYTKKMAEAFCAKIERTKSIGLT